MDSKNSHSKKPKKIIDPLSIAPTLIEGYKDQFPQLKDQIKKEQKYT